MTSSVSAQANYAESFQNVGDGTDALGGPLAPIPTDGYQFVNPAGFEQRKFQLGFKVRF